MLKKLKELKDFKILANDTANETIGMIKDMYFDDERWAVRYLVVDTSPLFKEEQVLISPYNVSGIDWEDGIVWVNLSKKDIEHAPKAKAKQRVSRNFETRFNNYFKLPHYWSNGLGLDIEGIWAGAFYPYKPEEDPQTFRSHTKEEVFPETDLEGEIKADHHLHSMDELSGFHLRAVDDENFGKVEDFIMEADTWAIRYIVIDTHKFLPGGKKILLAPEWVERFDWEDKKLITDFLRHTIEQCPSYDPMVPIDRMMEEELHAHFGQTGYWTLRGWNPPDQNQPLEHR